jgi:hypothetical protein
VRRSVMPLIGTTPGSRFSGSVLLEGDFKGEL